MRIGVISDTHDRLPTMRQALATFAREGVGAVLHAGDLVAPFAAKLLSGRDLPRGAALHVVYGNNDGERAGLAAILPQITDGPLRLRLAGVAVVMVHDETVLTPAEVEGADVVVVGHTHEPVNERRDGRLVLNPGEACGWVTGRCTAAVLDTETITARIIDLQPEPEPD